MSICTGYNRCSPANIGFLLYRHTLLHRIRPRPFPIGQQPIVVGGMGGSGTRVLVPILQMAGYWMGSWICRRTQDAMPTRHLLQVAFNQLFDGSWRRGHMDALTSRLIQAHRAGMPRPDGAWGWKNPRSMWIIPYLVSLYPGMKFIHVIRDGRDMALTSNHNLLHKHGAFLLGEPDCEREVARSQFRLWAMGNLRASETGSRYLGENYMLLDYDRLCSHPHEELARIYGFVGIAPSPSLLADAGHLIASPRGSGRWRRSDNPLVHQPGPELSDALSFFGYE